MTKSKNEEKIEFSPYIMELIEKKKKKGPKFKFTNPFKDNPLKNPLKNKRKHVPMTFNVGMAFILFFVYLSITLILIPTSPITLLVLIPTLYILIVFIRNERKREQTNYG